MSLEWGALPIAPTGRAQDAYGMSETDSPDGEQGDADPKRKEPPEKPVIEPLDDAPEGFEPV
ncbi:hypothetical protein GCM10022248_51600 [Nonomuraea soli]